MPLENEEIKDTAEGIGTQAENAAGAEESAASREEAQVSAEEAAGAEAQAEAGNDEAAVEAEAEQDPAAEAEALKVQLAEGAERMKRLQADFENFRRRTRQEKEELSNMVVQDFIKELLPMLDNFDRAMAAEATDAAKFQQGVEMIYNQLTEILKNKGMELIDTKDAKFDPNFHQAVMRVENPDLEDEAIAMELQKGYMVKGKVIRPSMVQVVANS
ncbi:MAG: nucleotide exchange factor GrpE [Selenomonadaceae bacterium]|uniref:nucleotide exchange factor GrpE n=1 Tax=Anaerovibrio slackiae TaxID=2652309 RepID=UPI0023F0A23D|nr:nucleotide exchange factor GrpE [Anaerovibrio slackiae]MBQ2410539.1 nucleotide exchange factor GrpE [Selenomonadaceae bacterium]MBQ5732980.1 nucleotide exchange factor GrpE [Selenomonadaceae bacterium]MBQ5845030.1 nucleotide exchange factor GrpE [Selenomonadaceae bacterium]MBQ5920231.1 nucleotide exchange factor GrpE [Selenomonadaceae bacterium]MBR0329344.1 nucleotide exchange factor GrpE [Selenomonadaceae bacterium]